MVSNDPRQGRFETAARLLRAAAVATGVLAATAVVLPEPVDHTLAVVAVAVVALVPVVRLTWLGIRWIRRGDRTFAWIPFAILAVISVGLVVTAA